MADDTMGTLVPFGKYKGRPVEELVADRSYCEWLAAQPWFRDRFVNVYNVIVNYGTEPADTPAHNAMQLRFLEHDYCMAFARKICPHDLDGYVENPERDEMYGPMTITRDEPITFKTKFECNGWDCSLQINGGILMTGFEYYGDHMTYKREKYFSYGPWGLTIMIECKPTIGNDFPSVLRQVKRYPNEDPRVVIVGSYSGTAPWSSVDAMFAADGIRLICRPRSMLDGPIEQNGRELTEEACAGYDRIRDQGSEGLKFREILQYRRGRAANWFGLKKLPPPPAGTFRHGCFWAGFDEVRRQLNKDLDVKPEEWPDDDDGDYE